MELYIDTTEQGVIKLQIRKQGNIAAKLEKKTLKVSENLLVEMEKLLKQNRIKFAQLKKITVNPGPGGFSSTRTGVAVANALNFALGVNKVVLPKYDKAPNITRPRRKSIIHNR